MVKLIPHLSFDSKEIEIVPLGDVHYGSKHMSLKRFKHTVNYILRKKCCYCVLMGDLVEMVTRGQKGSMLLEQGIEPTDQIIGIIKLLKPLAKAGKILGSVRDNHLARTEKDALLDMNLLLAQQLEVPYWGVGGLIVLTINGKKRMMALQHGKDCCQNKFTACAKMMRVYPGCDAYILGHNHHLGAQPVVTIESDPNGMEKGIRRWFIRTGSYLKYAPYAQEALYDPPIIGSPIIKMTDRGIVDVDVTTLSWYDDED